MIKPSGERSFRALAAFVGVARTAGAGLFAGIAFLTPRAAPCGTVFSTGASAAGADAARRGAFNAGASGVFTAVLVKALVALAFAVLLGTLAPTAGAAFLAVSATCCTASVARLALGLKEAVGDVFLAMIKLGFVVGKGLVQPQGTSGNNTAQKNGKSCALRLRLCLRAA